VFHTSAGNDSEQTVGWYQIMADTIKVPGLCVSPRKGNSLGYFFDSDQSGTYHIPRLMKVMGFITQGAHLYGGQDIALNHMLNHAMLMRCVPVAGDLPDSYIGSGGWTGGRPGRNSLKERYEKGDDSALITMKSVRQVTRRALETVSKPQIVFAGTTQIDEKAQLPSRYVKI
jgi:hypothetical protein